MHSLKSSGSQDQNRHIRVFVSSTFKDMMEERNALMTHTWPELRRFCKERQVELVEVDLRWGIAEEQSTRKETLKLCLDEIRACRPFFIGLLGERYGWVPDINSFTADLQEEQPWLKDLHGKSVTELEILHGVLNNPDMAERAFFYFRDPRYAQEHGDIFLPENENAAEKQSTLKALIRNMCLKKNIPLRENYPDPDSLAKTVLEQLRKAIEAQFPKKSIPDPLVRETLDHEAYAEIRRRTYIGRLTYFDALDYHCNDNGKPLLVSGSSGTGKSTLIANWVERWRKAHPKDLIFLHYIGSTTDSTSHWKLMIRLMAEIKRWSNDNTELPKTNDEILRDFTVWLAKARIKAELDGIKFIVILDALNQLEDSDNADTLGWLPTEPFRDNMRLIVSSLPGPAMDALEKRTIKLLQIELLTIDERARMIVDYLKRFGKSLDKPRIDRISNNKAAANPLYLKILLDELRVTGTHEKFDERLNDYLKADDVPVLLLNILARYQSDYEHDRKGMVSEALGLIWASRRGLTETELLQLLRPDNLPQLPLAIWSPLRAVLEENLINRGGILNFAHDFLRTAVESAFLPDNAKKDNFRKQLAGYFGSIPPSMRSCDEMAWLLWKMNEKEALCNCLLDIERFSFLYMQDEIELLQYWIQLCKEREMGQLYIDAFNEWSLLNKKNLEKYSSSLKNLGMFLYAASLFSNAETFLKLSLEFNETNYSEEHPELADSLYNLARLLSATNRLNEGEPLFRRALVMTEKLFGVNHPKVAIILNDIVNVMKATNRLIEAEPLMSRALDIDESNFGKNHPKVAFDLNNLSEILKYTNRQSDAEQLTRRALNIDETYYGNNHIAVARDLNNLAGIIRSVNRWQEAESLYRKSLKIMESNYGPNHVEIANSLNNLAHVLMASNNFIEAESFYWRALEIDEMNYGKNHVVVALDLSHIANLLCYKKQLSDAEPLYRRTIEILLEVTKKTGYIHPQLKRMVDLYRIVIAKLGLFDNKSSELLEKAKLYYFS